jgi:hypothetical protein
MFNETKEQEKKEEINGKIDRRTKGKKDIGLFN